MARCWRELGAWQQLPPGGDVGGDSTEDLTPGGHPIRGIRPLAGPALGDLQPTFGSTCAEIGRPSIPPEHLLQSCLPMTLCSIRSERQFCERPRCDLVFKCFLGLNVEDEHFGHFSFAKNSRQLLGRGRINPWRWYGFPSNAPGTRPSDWKSNRGHAFGGVAGFAPGKRLSDLREWWREARGTIPPRTPEAPPIDFEDRGAHLDPCTPGPDHTHDEPGPGSQAPPR